MIRLRSCSAVLAVMCACSPLCAEGPAVGGKTVQLEIVLATADVPLEGAVTQERPTGPAMLAQIEQGAKGGKLKHLSRVRLQTLENLPTQIQFSESVWIATGRNFQGARGGPPVMQATYTREEAGTLVSATSRIEGGGMVLVELTVEQSRFEPAAASAEPADENGSFVPPVKKKMQTGRTTIRLKDGVPEIVGGYTISAGDGTTQSVVLLTAHVQQP